MMGNGFFLIHRAMVISVSYSCFLLIFGAFLAFAGETKQLHVNIVEKSGQEISIMVDSNFYLNVRHGAMNDVEVQIKFVDSIEQIFPKDSAMGILTVKLIDGSCLVGSTRGDCMLGGYSVEFIKKAKILHPHEIQIPVSDKNLFLTDKSGSTLECRIKDMEFEVYLINNNKDIGIIEIPSLFMVQKMELKDNKIDTYSITFSNNKTLEGRPLNYGVGWEYGSLTLSFGYGPNDLALVKNVGPMTPMPTLFSGPKDRRFHIKGLPFEMWNLRKYSMNFRETARSGNLQWGQYIKNENTTLVLEGQPPKEIDMSDVSNIFVEDQYNVVLTLKDNKTVKGRIFNIDYFSAMTPFGRIRMGLQKLEGDTINFID